MISEHIQGTEIDEGGSDETTSITSMSEAVYATAANVFDYVTNNLVAPFNVACSPKKSRRTDLGQEVEVPQSISQSGLGVGSGTAHHYDVESTAASTKVKLSVRTGEVTEEDTENCCQLIPDSKGTFGAVLTSPLLDLMVCYIISTFPETQQREGVVELYDSRACREALVSSIVDIIQAMMEESHFHLVIHLSHEEWRVHRRDQPRFILIMSSVIRQIIERVEQEFIEEATFHIVVYFKTGEHRGIFELGYSDMEEEDDPSDDNGPRLSVGKRSFGDAKEAKFPETSLGASPGRSNNQEDTGSITRRSPSSNSTNESRESQGIESNRCDLCDKINEGPLTVMWSPPEQIGHRIPRRLRLCEDCRHTEASKNRRHLAEDEETRRREQLLEKQRKEALATAAYETKMAELEAAKLKFQHAEVMKLGSGNTNIPRVTRVDKVRMEEEEYALDLEEAIRKEKIKMLREEAEIIDQEEAEMTALAEEIRIRRKSRSPIDSTSTLRSGLRSPGGSEKSSNCSKASLPTNRRVSFHSGLTGEEEAAWELEGVYPSEISGSTRANKLRAGSANRLESRLSWSSKEPIRGGNSTSPSGRGLSADRDAVSYDEELEDEEQSPRKQGKGGKGRTEEPLAKLLSKIPQGVDDSTRAQLEMMAVQTATMQQKVAQNELTLEKTQLNETLVLLKWVKDAIDGQVVASAGSHLAKIRDQSKGIPPDSTIVGQAFVEVWRIATEACTQMVWKENQYACAIHVFAKLMDHTIKWIQEPITSLSLAHQNWKTEPQRYFDGILRHWGLKSLDKLQRIELPDLIDLVKKSDRGTKRFKRATEETQTLIRDLGNIHPEQMDEKTYKDFTLTKAFDEALKKTDMAEAILNQYSNQKLLLLKKRYSHDIKKYIVDVWRPWSRVVGEQNEWPHANSGHPLYVYYLADLWLASYPKVRDEGGVKVDDIRDLIDGTDVDKRAIGTDLRIMRELSCEIPDDHRWRNYAYQVQNKVANLWNSPRLTPAYSGHFADLPAYFNHISDVAAIMSRTGPRTAETKESVPVSTVPNRKHKGPHVMNVVKVETNPTYEPDERSRESDDEDEVYEETQTNSLSTVNFSKSLQRVFEATGVNRILLDQVITREEFERGISTAAVYEHKPRTFAGLKFHLDHDYGEKKGLRLCRYVQDALDRLCKRFGIEDMVVTEKELEGCHLGLRAHLNQGSHTAITCTQGQGRGTNQVPCMEKLNGEAAQLMTKENLTKQCQEKAKEQCKSGKCLDTGFKNCKAMKQYYFRVVMPPQLVGSFENLEGYAREKIERENGRPTSSTYQMDSVKLKQLMLSIIIQAFTTHWNGPDRN